jgi:hypothetical protein
VEQNIRIPVDIARAQYLVTANPGPKVADRRTGVQKVDKRSDLPMWTTELTQIGSTGARVIQVTTVAPDAPVVAVGQTVVPEGLEAMPWESKDDKGVVRFGIAYRADELRVPVIA